MKDSKKHGKKIWILLYSLPNENCNTCAKFSRFACHAPHGVKLRKTWHTVLTPNAYSFKPRFGIRQIGDIRSSGSAIFVLCGEVVALIRYLCQLHAMPWMAFYTGIYRIRFSIKTSLCFKLHTHTLIEVQAHTIEGGTWHSQHHSVSKLQKIYTYMYGEWLYTKTASAIII